MHRRLRIAAAIEQSVSVGRVPAKRELSAWVGADDTIQLGFASLLATSPANARRAAELSDAVTAERAGLVRLAAALSASVDPDEARVSSLRNIRAAHAGERVLAFTEFAGTARALFARMRGDAGVALLTATDAKIASGRLPRDALLERFAPRARGAPDPVARERITILITTDLLSEGVNLQDASVVVHLDLPWNPARLAQRVGRVRRPGGAPVVHAYLIAPPARTELLLDVERRLRRKLADAARTIGRGIDVVPCLSSLPDPTRVNTGRAALIGATAERVARWHRPPATPAPTSRQHPLVAGVACADAGWLAALDDGQLLASFGGAPADTHTSVARAVDLANGPARPVSPSELREALARCERWTAARILTRWCGIDDRGSVDAALDQRIAHTLLRAPRHLRSSLARQASMLVTSLSAHRPLGAERAMRRLLDDADDSFDPDWLATAVELAAPGARRPLPVHRARVAAVILFGP
jgi:hypothetical protein